MNWRNGKAVLWSMALILVLALAFLPAAQSLADRGDQGMGDHGRAKVGHGHEFGGMGKIFARLNLTKAQKHDIALILKANREDMKNVVSNLVAARKNLFAAVRGPEYNEAAVRQASGEVARWEEEAAVLRAKIITEGQKVLTPQQKEKLSAIRARFGEKMERRMEKRFERLDRWIDRHAGEVPKSS